MNPLQPIATHLEPKWTLANPRQPIGSTTGSNPSANLSPRNTITILNTLMYWTTNWTTLFICKSQQTCKRSELECTWRSHSECQNVPRDNKDKTFVVLALSSAQTRAMTKRLSGGHGHIEHTALHQHNPPTWGSPRMHIKECPYCTPYCTPSAPATVAMAGSPSGYGINGRHAWSPNT